jgi:hypothetical protein
MFYEDQEVEARCSKWLSTVNALALLKRHYHNQVHAQERLISWAGADLIPTKCRRMVITGLHPAERDECLIAPDYWAEFESTSARHREDWISGDFVLKRWNRYDEDRKVKVFKVTFCEADLLKLIPADVPTPAVPSLEDVREIRIINQDDTARLGKARGGAPRKDWWDDLWIEMIRRIRAGTLTPQSAADLQRTMLTWLGDQEIYPGDDTLKKTARKLFKYLEE